MAYQLEKERSSVFRSHPTSDPLSSTFGLPRGTNMPRDAQDYQIVEKTPILANLVTFFHKHPKRSVQMPKSVCLPEVARHERAKTGSFTLSAACEQPRVGMTNDLVNLLCHLIGNRMISHFWKCDVKCKNY